MVSSVELGATAATPGMNKGYVSIHAVFKICTMSVLIIENWQYIEIINTIHQQKKIFSILFFLVYIKPNQKYDSQHDAFSPIVWCRKDGRDTFE